MKNKFKVSILIILGLLIFAIFGVFIEYQLRWDRNVTQNGIEFEKLSKDKSSTIIGYTKENQIFNNFPCEKGWTHFYPDWKLKNCFLSEEFAWEENKFSQGTWLILNENTIIEIVSLPEDMEIQGYLIDGSKMGSEGTHTSFYENGKLKSFFSPQDEVLVDDKLCKGGLFSPIRLNEDGSLDNCNIISN